MEGQGKLEMTRQEGREDEPFFTNPAKPNGVKQLRADLSKVT